VTDGLGDYPVEGRGYTFLNISEGSRTLGIISEYFYEGWNFNSGNYLFTTDTK